MNGSSKLLSRLAGIFIEVGASEADRKSSALWAYALINAASVAWILFMRLPLPMGAVVPLVLTISVCQSMVRSFGARAGWIALLGCLVVALAALGIRLVIWGPVIFRWA